MNTLADYLTHYAHSQAHAPVFKLAHGAELPYGVLFSSMQAVAALLREHGITRQKRVAVILPSGPEFAAAVLSISACAVCVPLNPASTSSEMEGMLSWLRVDAVILQSNSIHEATCRKSGLLVLPMHFSLSGEAGDFAPERASVFPPFDDWAQPDDIAIVFHTSGTTAKPKVVPITHRNLCSPLPQYIRYYNLSDQDSIISATPLFHAFGIHIMLTTTVASGGSVIFLSDYSVETLLAGVRDYRATRFAAVPVVLDSLADHVRRRELPPEPTGLRYIHTGGAPIKPETLLCVEAYFAAPVVVGYGLSELGVTLTASPLPPHHRVVESVGRVIHSEVAIVDETMAGLPPLTSGEVVVRGPAVFAGYENDAEANAASFTEGWFRTGDQGYFDHAGLLFINGRFKEIINKGGQKVAPLEVDEALRRLAGVRDAVCFPIPHGRLGEDVAAAIVLQAGANLNDADIRRMLRAELSEYKIPGKIVFIDAIPQNANGKILRNSLYATLAAKTPELFCKGAYAAPQTAMEAELVEMWQALLGLEAVSVREGFFSLGGDSLQAAVMLAQVQERWGVDLPVSVLLEAGTICELAARIADRLSPLDALVAIQPMGTEPPLFFVHARDGDIMQYFSLKPYFSAEQPLFALRFTDCKQRRNEKWDVPRLAESYIERIQQVQPHGPYRLLGHSFGGMVAYEMAVQLSAAGEAVELVGLLDSGAPRFQRGPQCGFRQRIQDKWKLCCNQSPRGWPGFLINQLRSKRDYWMERLDRRNQTVQLLMNLADQYAPPIYSGNVVMFRAADDMRTLPGQEDPVMGWRPYIRGEISVVEIPGTHTNFIQEPKVQVLADKIREYCGKERGDGPFAVLGLRKE